MSTMKRSPFVRISLFPPISNRISALLLLTVTFMLPLARAEIIAAAPGTTIGQIDRFSPAAGNLLEDGAVIEVLASGFTWSEGPVWVPWDNQLVFSDVPENKAYRWREGHGVDLFLDPSGASHRGPDISTQGSNGFAVHKGKILLCQVGDRRIASLDTEGKTFSTIVDRYDGKRFSAPNDLCIDRRGNIYFTDPPYGLVSEKQREIPFNGVYRLAPDGRVTLITSELERPNGIALSPDDKTLYVTNSHAPNPIVMAFALTKEGAAEGPGRVVRSVADLIKKYPKKGSLDGMKVDQEGNLWMGGVAGVVVISKEGVLLAHLVTGHSTGNCCFGGPDGRTLFITSDNMLCRVRTKTRDGHFAAK